jgi:hypothetical protein
MIYGHSWELHWHFCVEHVHGSSQCGTVLSGGFSLK